MQCIRCRRELDEGTVNCPYCGESQPPSKPQKEVKNPNAIAGFICSIWGSVALIILSLLTPIFGIPLVGISLSATGVKKADEYDGYGKNLAIAGIVIGCIGAIISLAIFSSRR